MVGLLFATTVLFAAAMAIDAPEPDKLRCHDGENNTASCCLHVSSTRIHTGPRTQDELPVSYAPRSCGPPVTILRFEPLRGKISLNSTIWSASTRPC